MTMKGTDLTNHLSHGDTEGACAPSGPVSSACPSSDPLQLVQACVPPTALLPVWLDVSVPCGTISVYAPGFPGADIGAIAGGLVGTCAANGM